MPARKKSTTKRTTAQPTEAKSETAKNERKCPSCGKVHGSSFVSETELAMLDQVRGRTEDGSPSGVYRVFTHDVFYIRAHEHDDTCAAVHPQEVSK